MDAKDNENGTANNIELTDYYTLSPRERLEKCAETISTFLAKQQFKYRVVDCGMSILYRVPYITEKGYDSVFEIKVMEDPSVCHLNIRIPTTLSAGHIFRLLNFVNSHQYRTLGGLTYSISEKTLTYAFQIITKHGLYEDELETATEEMLIWSRHIVRSIKWWEEKSKEEELAVHDKQ